MPLVGLGAVSVVLGPALGQHVVASGVHQAVEHRHAQDGAIVTLESLLLHMF